MAAFTANSKIVNPILWSLAHLSTVAVAHTLLEEFDGKTLNKAYWEIQSESSPASVEDRDLSCVRAKEKLLFIPSHLRKDVSEAVHGMELEMDGWIDNHPEICDYRKKRERFLWKSDGTIDTIQMAQQVVLDRSISTRRRFEIACKHGLEKSVRTLWAAMEASEKEFIETAGQPMIRFWVRWLHEGCLVPWTEAAVVYLDFLGSSSLTSRFSSFFPMLRPEERQKFLIPLQTSRPGDLLTCLYSMTKEEEEETVRAIPLEVLYLYMNWPLQRFFPEVAEKLLNYIDAHYFWVLLCHFVILKSREDFDYAELFRVVWVKSSDRLKKSARIDRNLMAIINSSRKLKRIVDADDDNNTSIDSKTISSDTRRLTKWPRRS